MIRSGWWVVVLALLALTFDVPPASAQGARGKLTVSPGTLTFPTVGLTRTATKSLMVRNAGTGPLTGTVSALADPFRVVSGGGAYTLGADEFRSVTVEFAPTAAGRASRALVITSNDPRLASLTVPVTGVGEGGRLVVSARAIAFSVIGTGSSERKSLVLQNTGRGPLSGAVAALLAPFSVVAGGGSYTLASGASRTVTVEFAPTTSGRVTETLVITSDDLKLSAVAVSVTGDGHAGRLVVSPKTVTFSRTPVGSTRFSYFTVRNTDKGVLTGSVGSTTSPFSVDSGGGPFTLANGGTLTVKVLFSPRSNGRVHATVVITSNDPQSPSTAVSLSGEGFGGGGLSEQFEDRSSVSIVLALFTGQEPGSVLLEQAVSRRRGAPDARRTQLPRTAFMSPIPASVSKSHMNPRPVDCFV